MRKWQGIVVWRPLLRGIAVTNCSCRGESWSGDHSYGESQLQTAPTEWNRGLETTPTGNRSYKLLLQRGFVVWRPLLRGIAVTNCPCRGDSWSGDHSYGESQLQTAPTEWNRGLETTPTWGIAVANCSCRGESWSGDHSCICDISAMLPFFIRAKYYYERTN